MKIVQLGNHQIQSSLFRNLSNFVFKKFNLDYQIKPLYGKGNAGDTAIDKSFQELFKEMFVEPRITKLHVHKIYNSKDIDIINSHDVLFLSGGGLFLYDTFENNVSDWQWGISENLLDKIEIPIVVYSIGFNKFRGQRDFKPIFNDTVNKLVEKSIFFSMRNNGSINKMKYYIRKENMLKINLNYCPTLLLNDKLYNFHNSLNNNNVGFVLAGDRLNLRHRNLRHFVNEIKKFVDYLKKMKIETILVNHMNDDWILDHIEFDSKIDLYRKSASEVYETYSKIDTVISDRGHGQMIPFSVGCKIISPISHNKLQWFLDDLKLSSLGIEESYEHLSREIINQYEQLNTMDWVTIHKNLMNEIKQVNKKNLIQIRQKLFDKKIFD